MAAVAASDKGAGREEESQLIARFLAGQRGCERAATWLAGKFGCRWQPPSMRSATAGYHDSADLWFARAGVQLVVRRAGRRRQLVLERASLAPSEPGRLAEMSQDVPRGSRSRLKHIPPGPIRGLVLACGGPVEVECVCTVVSQRVVREALTPAGERLRLTWQQSVAKRRPRGTVLLEYAGERPGKAKAAASAMAKALGLKPALSAAPNAELAKAGLAALGPPPPQARPDDCLAAAAYRVLRGHLAEVRAFEPAARLGVEIEGVHQMRVATRRLRAALTVFRDLFAAARVAALERDLRWLGDTLGEVRDLDVYLDNLPGYAAELGAAHNQALEHFVEHLWRQRQRARRVLLRRLNSRRYQSFLERFEAFLAGERADPESPRAQAGVPEASRHLLVAEFERVRARAGKTLRQMTPRRLHRARIAARRLRYVCEWFSGLYGKRFAGYIQRVKEIQSLLGRHQDACVAIDNLTRLASELAESGEDGEHRETLLRLIASKRKVTAKVESEFPRAWRKFEHKKCQRKYLWEPLAQARNKD